MYATIFFQKNFKDPQKQDFLSSGLGASTSRFCMSVGRSVGWSKKNVKNIKKCQKNVKKTVKNCQKCQKMSINVKKCQKMSKNVKKYKDS